MWKNLIGMKFGHLTAIKRADDYVYPSSGRHEPRYICECDCGSGNLVTAIQHNLLNGHTTNCGCDPNKTKGKLVDMIGMKFGHLTVIKRVEDQKISGKQVTMYECECDCENHTHVIVQGRSLRTGHTTSCGCARIEASTKHGYHGTRIYGIYKGMKNRCYNENDKRFKWYGGRGIIICDEWLGEDGFIHFKDWAFANGYSDELTIDRIDNDGNYEPSNCRWVDMKVQSNNKHNNVVLEYNGETHTIAEWAEIVGISSFDLYNRYNLGWDIKKILTTPINDYIKVLTDSKGESHTISEWGEILGINRDTIYDRIAKLGWNVDRALHTPVKDGQQYIEYNGETHNYHEWEIIRGFSDDIISHRLSKGWSPEKAIEIVAKKQKRNAIYFDYEGKLYREMDWNLRYSSEMTNAIYFVDDDGNPLPQ